MIEVRRAGDRGQTRLGWLHSYHTFSFGDYQDPDYMGFRALRVLNDDFVAPGAGFPMHEHRNMEIVTWVLEGALEHKDNLGNEAIIRSGDVQGMSAGSGLTHSESNASKTEPVRFIQIWFMPEAAGTEPRYDHQNFPVERRKGRLCMIASPDGRAGTVKVGQDVRLFTTMLDPGQRVRYVPAPERFLWLHVSKGVAIINEEKLSAGDAVYAAEGPTFHLMGGPERGCELLIFDLC